MDADNYYVQAGDMHDLKSLVEELGFAKMDEFIKSSGWAEIFKKNSNEE